MFETFVEAVHKSYSAMAEAGELYVVDHRDEILWQTYLQSFPKGTNPIYKERTEHDCNTCRQFIKRLGGVVSIQGGQRRSVWDVELEDHTYSAVAEALSRLVHALPIVSVFRSSEKQYGCRTTKYLEEDKLVVWTHLHGEVAPAHRSKSVSQEVGRFESTAGVFARGLEELSLEALDEVIALVSSDSTAIYRGVEYLESMRAFRALKQAYEERDEAGKEVFVWENLRDQAARFKNSVIGTLIKDLSEGDSLEKAVKSFEKKVAPSNYKRPKKLISKGMIERAMKTIDEIGLRDSLERRHARISDVSVNDILFVDRSSRPLMRDALMETLMTQVKPRAVETKGAVEISMEEFIERVVPQVESMEVKVEAKHTPRFMSITAPAHPGEPRLFSWHNDFSWSYVGNLADSSIKQRVKAAGGDVSAPFRVSLGWFNYDDLDLHVVEPNGNHIYFGNKSGKLDVDMNVSTRGSREAVENVRWPKPSDGVYAVSVKNYTRRESIDVGFQLEVENQGQIRQYDYPKALGQGEKVEALLIELKKGRITSSVVQSGLNEERASKEHWGVQTESFVKVQTLMKSPNHWHGERHGNAHWFFILEGCLNPDPVRGMYNENLRGDLHDHRKVFEVLGSKMMCEPSEEQLSGLGFSSTQRAEVLIKVRGEVNRLFDVRV